MKSTRICMFVITASLVAGAIAQADETAPTTEKPEKTALYEGVAENGTVVRLTIADHSIETFERLSPPRGPIHATPHWSSLFGTGKAAEAERQTSFARP